MLKNKDHVSCLFSRIGVDFGSRASLYRWTELEIFPSPIAYLQGEGSELFEDPTDIFPKMGGGGVLGAQNHLTQLERKMRVSYDIEL